MTSIVETTAVALRRGNREQNEAFVGVEGELVGDLGTPSEDGTVGVAADATLRFHNGITPGGIPMARADLQNITTENLAKNRDLIGDKNLAYADLSNLAKTTDENAISKIKTTFKTYGFADNQEINQKLEEKVNLDTLNLNTKYLASEEFHDGSIEGNDALAYANTTNINTSDLVNIDYHNGVNGNYPLAYNNCSNVDTTNLAKTQDRPETMSGPVLATATLDNVDTSNITNPLSFTEGNLTGPVVARADLANVNLDDLSNILIQDTLGLEKTSNKDLVINEGITEVGHYPETTAVVEYVTNKLNGSVGDLANTSLTNVTSWDMLYSASEAPIVYRKPTLISSQDKFKLGESYDTGIWLTEDEQELFWVSVASVNTAGKIEANSIYIRDGKNIGSMDLTNIPLSITSDTNVEATFTVDSVLNQDGTYSYSINTVNNGGSGFHVKTTDASGNEIYDGEYLVKIKSTSQPCKIIYSQLKIIPTGINPTDSTSDETLGTITKIICDPEYGRTNVNVDNVIIGSDENTTASLSIASSVYNTLGGAGLAKVDMTNLKGMSPEDQLAERNSAWRIRHDEYLPDISYQNLNDINKFTLATNEIVWKGLKQVYELLNNVPCVTINVEFLPNEYQTSDVVSFEFKNLTDDKIINPYSEGDLKATYVIFPNTRHQLTINSTFGAKVIGFPIGKPIGAVDNIKYFIDENGDIQVTID